MGRADFERKRYQQSIKYISSLSHSDALVKKAIILLLYRSKIADISSV